MRIGILGGGQLARLLGLAGYELGLSFRCLDASKEACAAEIMPHSIGSGDDAELLRQFLNGVDCVTFETENISPAVLDALAAAGAPVFPPQQAVRISQDRLLEKTFLQRTGWLTAPFRAVDTLTDLEASASELGFPLILKTRRMGYDGKGQRVVREAGALHKAFAELGGQDLIAEGFVPFSAEGSLLAVRGKSGELAFYPVVRNVHREGVLFSTELWQDFPVPLEKLQEDMGRLLEDLHYCGVLALEFFLHGDQVIANELAPRVHNSGHWTMHAAMTSQFENHVRAIAGLPLGATDVLVPFRMLNLLSHISDPSAILAIPGAKLCDYTKRPVPGRKLGHVTLLQTKAGDFEGHWQKLLSLDHEK